MSLVDVFIIQIKSGYKRAFVLLNKDETTSTFTPHYKCCRETPASWDVAFTSTLFYQHCNSLNLIILYTLNF